jgi:hypothetical protein
VARRPSQLTGQSDKLRIALEMRFATAALLALGKFAIAGRLQFGDKHGFVELRYGTKELPNELGRRRVIDKCRSAIGGNQLHA